MLKVGTRPSHAEVLADNLTMADYRGKEIKSFFLKLMTSSIEEEEEELTFLLFLYLYLSYQLWIFY